MRGVAAFINSTSPRFLDLAEPEGPGPGEVLCRTLELGVCGTDREILASAKPWVPAGSDFLVLGHECLARVEAAGAGVETLRPGDLVVPLVRRALPGSSFRGSASERTANEALPRDQKLRRDPTGDACPEGAMERERRVDLLPIGDYVERGIIVEHGFSLPRWLDRPEFLIPIEPRYRSLAVFTEPQSVAEKAANEALRLQQGRLGADAWTDRPPRVLVTGMGPIALAAIIASISRGWPTTVLGRDETDTFRAQLVGELGARYLPKTAAQFDDMDVEQDGFDLVLECTGSEEVILSTARSMASCAVMVWLGSQRVHEVGQYDLARLIRDGLLRNQIFLGSVNAAVRDFYDAMRNLQTMHALRPKAVEAIITARVPPEEALWHFENRQPQGIKTVVEYDH